MKKLMLYLRSTFCMSVLMLCALGFSVPQTVTAATVSQNQVCSGVGAVFGKNNCDAGARSNINKYIAIAVNILSFIIGVTAVIMIIVGGFKYITSAGDSAGVNSAKNTILYAIIGLIIVALAQSIVHFVLKRVGT